MRKKIIILSCFIFVVAFFLGIFTTAQIRNHKIRQVKPYFSEREYVRHISRMVDLSEEQKETFGSIADKYIKENGKLTRDYFKVFGDNMKKFESEIDSRLTEEQKDRIKKIEEERRQMFEDFMEKRKNDSVEWENEHRYRHNNDRRYYRKDHAINPIKD